MKPASNELESVDELQKAVVEITALRREIVLLLDQLNQDIREIREELNCMSPWSGSSSLQ